MVLGGVALIALTVLAVRSYTRLELRWDAWLYHIPFAAKEAGIDVPYSMPLKIQSLYEGHPFLPHFIMGALWRITGNINTVGVINIIGFTGFLTVCHRLLRAPFYVVALIALTTPLVIIHAATSYIDLFSNSLLAIGLCTLAFVYLFDKRMSRQLFWVGVGGLVGAMWSKPQLGLMGAMGLVGYVLVYRPWDTPSVVRTRRYVEFAVVAVVAFGNNLKNLALYGNPLWPVEMPVFHNLFPATYHFSDPALKAQRPPALSNVSQVELFVRSLFETNNPIHYPNRLRWIIDQGNTSEALRMGGFWNVNVVLSLVVAVALLLLVGNKRGRVVAIAGAVMLAALATQPNSHDLRYYLFIPLCWSGVIGMLYREFKYHYAGLAVGLLVGVAVLFGVMVQANKPYYQVTRVDYRDAAAAWGADAMWQKLRPGYTYCSVDAAPVGFFYTGPTRSEFRIVDRESEATCPAGSVSIIRGVVHHERRN